MHVAGRDPFGGEKDAARVQRRERSLPIAGRAVRGGHRIDAYVEAHME